MQTLAQTRPGSAVHVPGVFDEGPSLEVDPRSRSYPELETSQPRSRTKSTRARGKAESRENRRKHHSTHGLVCILVVFAPFSADACTMLRFVVGCALSLIALPTASALTSDEQLGLGMGLGVGLGVLLGVVFISYMVCVRARAPEVAKARDEDLIYAAPETKTYMVPVPSTTSVAVPAEVVVVDGAAASSISVSAAAAAAAPVVMPAVGSATPVAALNKHVEVMSRTSMYAGKEVRAHKVTSLGRGRRGSTATPIPDAAALAPRSSTPVYPDLVDKEAAAEGATPLTTGKPSLESAGQDDVAVGLANGEVEGEGTASAGPKYDEDGEEIHEGVPAHKIHVEFRPQEGPVLGSAAKQLRIKQLHRADSQGNAVTMFASPDDVRHRLAIKAGNAAGGGGSPFAGARRESATGGAARRASGVAGASNGTPGFADAIAAARRGSGTSATGGGIPRPPSAATNI